MLQWDESYSVKIASIDAQHKELFGAVARFEEAVEAGEGVPALLRLLGFLIHYAEEHFATEEVLFEKCGYEQTESHREQHTAFLHNVKRYQARFEAGDVILPVELTTFLEHWIREHVLSSDQRYVSCLLEHKVE